MGRNGNRLHGNGREWECRKPLPGISSSRYIDSLAGVVFDFEVFEGDADLFVVCGQEVVDARRVVRVIARVSR